VEVKPGLNYDVYHKFAICCNNALGSVNLNSNNNEILTCSVRTLRNCSNLVTTVDQGFKMRHDCVNLEENLFRIIHNNNSPICTSFSFDIFGNMLSTFDQLEQETNILTDFIFEHLYDDIFSGIESYDR
jgi:hypothetical protein